MEITATDLSGVVDRYGLIFFITLQGALGAMASIGSTISQRSVFYKQREAYFHRTSTYVVSRLVVNVPMQILENTLIGLLAFWPSELVGPNPGLSGFAVFCVFLVNMYMFSISFGAYITMVASASRSPEIAQVATSLSLAFMLLFSGFIIPQNAIPVYFIWIYWINPVAWIIRRYCIL